MLSCTLESISWVDLINFFNIVFIFLLIEDLTFEGAIREQTQIYLCNITYRL